MGEDRRTMSLTVDGEQLPVIDVVTGRGFITGKSGSGKSNTASVLAEELLAEGVPMMIIDTDGEYYGLKEQYELLHVGGDEHCDMQIGPRHADKVADLAVDRNVPIILDVSAFVEAEDARTLVHDVVRALFVKEKEAKTPLLLVIEEAHEFIPEQGGLDEVGEMLVRVAKRGRKRGLGVCAISQRPASVDKDYITQCDWLVWHRLTWENDTQVVSKILGSDAAEEIQTLDAGEAIMLTDWDDQERRVKFREKRTFDAGATPNLDDLHSPDLKSVGADLVQELEGTGADLNDGGADLGDYTGEADEAGGSAGAADDGVADGGASASGGAGGAGGSGGASGGGSGGGSATPASAGDDANAASADLLDDDVDPLDAGSAVPSDETAADVVDGDAASEPSEPSFGGDSAADLPATDSGGSIVTSNAGPPVERGGAPGDDRRRSNGRASADGGATRPVSETPADDPVWEVAEFAAYLVGALGTVTLGVWASIERTVVGLATDRRPRQHPGFTPAPGTDGRPAVGIAVAVVLVALGLALGVGLALFVV